MERLTDKQEKFVQELVKGKSQREAYRSSHPACKASDKTVDEMASKLFNSHKVNARYVKIRSRLAKEAEDEAIISAKDVLREIASIAKDDISNYLDFYPDNKSLSGIQVDIKNSKDIDTKNVSEVSIGANGQFKFKLYSRDTALYKLADILGLADSIGLQGAGNRKEIEKMSGEALEALAERIISERRAGK